MGYLSTSILGVCCHKHQVVLKRTHVCTLSSPKRAWVRIQGENQHSLMWPVHQHCVPEICIGVEQGGLWGFGSPLSSGSMAGPLSGLLSSYLSLLKAGGLWWLFFLKKRELGPPGGHVQEGTGGDRTCHLAASSDAFKKGTGPTAQRI